jgi:lipopolysaccharide export system protein LptA
MTSRSLVTLVCCHALALTDPALGQSLSFTSRDSNQPIDVTADGGIEWRQNDRLFIARGNARAQQGEVSVAADELVAHYRTSAGGGTEVFRVDALGNVTMASKDETAKGTAAVYDIDRGVLVMEGDPISLTTAKGSMTARGTLQYWSNERVAVAEGNAEARDESRRLKADRLTAYFSERPGGNQGTLGPLGKNELAMVRGEGNIFLTTAKEVVRGERGEYNFETGLAKLEGAVKMTQGDNQLNGAFALVDTKAGTSRLFGSAREAGVDGPKTDARVKALLAPKPRTQPMPAAIPAKPAG